MADIFLKGDKGIVWKSAVFPHQVQLHYDGWDLGKKITGNDIDHDHVDDNKAKKKAMIELEQRYNTKCNIDTSPLLVEEKAQQEWTLLVILMSTTYLCRY